MDREFDYRTHSPFVTGFRLGLTNKRLLLWLYLTNLAVGLYAALPFHARISPVLDHSFAAGRIAGRLDVSALGALMLNLGKHGTSMFAQAFHATLAYGFFANVLAAGIYFVFVTAEPPRLSIVVRSGLEYFWRFFRLMIFTIIIGGAILAALNALRHLILMHANNVSVGRTYFTISIITLLIVLLTAVFLRLWFDIAEAKVAILGQTGIRRVRRTIGPSWTLLWRRFGAAYFGYLLVAIIGAAGFAFFLWLWVAFDPPRAVWLAWILGQLGMAWILAARIWQRGLATALAVSAEPVVQPAQAIVVEPVNPTPAAPYIPPEPLSEPPASNSLAAEG